MVPRVGARTWDGLPPDDQSPSVVPHARGLREPGLEHVGAGAWVCAWVGGRCGRAGLRTRASEREREAKQVSAFGSTRFRPIFRAPISSLTHLLLTACHCRIIPGFKEVTDE